MWLAAALLSAVFAAFTTILAKCGIKKTNPDLATAIRTGVILVSSAVMVWITGSFPSITQIDGKSFFFLILSGAATGGSWIFYFKSLSLGDVNKVTPIDKSSTILTVIIAIIFLGETDHLAVKLTAVVLIAFGTYLMIERKEEGKNGEQRGWLFYALLSAVCAAMTSVFAKIGIEEVESNLATFLRTIVVLIFAWGIVFAKKEQRGILKIDRKELLFLLFSGLSTGISWLCYYYAVSKGVLSIVVSLDKLSILFTILFSVIFLKEKIRRKSLIGLLFLCFGILFMALKG